MSTSVCLYAHRTGRKSESHFCNLHSVSLNQWFNFFAVVRMGSWIIGLRVDDVYRLFRRYGLKFGEIHKCMLFFWATTFIVLAATFLYFCHLGCFIRRNCDTHMDMFMYALWLCIHQNMIVRPIVFHALTAIATDTVHLLPKSGCMSMIR